MASLPKPKLIVFDLDYTLWPFWVDTHVDPPFKKKSNGKVVDCHGTTVKYYPEVPKVLARLHADGYQIGIASRTSAPDEANTLIKLFDWDKYFSYKEIYPGNKTTHFNRFKAASGIPLPDMLFFDDEYRNIQDLSRVGVTCVFIEDTDKGVTEEIVNMGLRQFAEKHSQKVI